MSPPAVGTLLRSKDTRNGVRTVRVIEHEVWHDGQVRRLRVENVETGRRTFLRYPLLSEWVWSAEPPKAGKK